MPTGDMWGPGVPVYQRNRPAPGYSKHGVKLAKPLRRVFFWLFVWFVGLIALFLTSTVVIAIVDVATKHSSS